MPTNISSGPRRPFRHFLFTTTIGRALASVLQAVALILVARGVSPAAFGEFAALLGVTVFAGVILDLGTSTLLLRQTRPPSELAITEPIIRLAWATSTAFAVLLGSLLLSGTVPIDYVPEHVSILLVLGLMLERIAELWITILIAEDRHRLAAILLVVRRVVPLIAVIGASVGSYSLFLAYGVSVAVVNIILTAICRSSLSLKDLPMPSRAATVLHDAVPFWMASMGSQLREMETPVVQAIVGAPTAGLYNVAYRLAKPAQMLASSLTQVLLVRATRGEPAVARRIVIATAYVCMTTLALGAAFAPVVPELITVILGSSYDATAGAAAISLVLSGLVVAASPLTGVLQSCGLERLASRVRSIGALSSLISLAIVASVTTSVTFLVIAALSPLVAQSVILFLLCWNATDPKG